MSSPTRGPLLSRAAEHGPMPGLLTGRSPAPATHLMHRGERVSVTSQLQALLAERILVLDGALGSPHPQAGTVEDTAASAFVTTCARRQGRSRSSR